MKIIKEIVHELECRVEELLVKFRDLELKINSLIELDPTLIIENDSRVHNEINKMIDIFEELKPIEKIIRFKFKEYNVIFDKLTQIQFERQNGKYMSFLAMAPTLDKRKYNKGRPKSADKLLKQDPKLSQDPNQAKIESKE